VNDIPLFTNLIRVETFYRDIKYVGMRAKSPTIPVILFFTVENITFFFRFNSETTDITEGDSQAIEIEDRTVSIQMGPLYEEDTLLDVREKMSLALEKAVRNVNVMRKLNQKAEEILGDVVGTRNFQIISHDEFGGGSDLLS
jgi:hypothetical protein